MATDLNNCAGVAAGGPISPFPTLIRIKFSHGEPDSRAKYRLLPPDIESDDMVVEVDTKMTAGEHHGHSEPEGDDRPVRLIVW
jgi:hypothetical protein